MKLLGLCFLHPRSFSEVFAVKIGLQFLDNLGPKNAVSDVRTNLKFGLDPGWCIVRIGGANLNDVETIPSLSHGSQNTLLTALTFRLYLRFLRSRPWQMRSYSPAVRSSSWCLLPYCHLCGLERAGSVKNHFTVLIFLHLVLQRQLKPLIAALVSRWIIRWGCDSFSRGW